MKLSSLCPNYFYGFFFFEDSTLLSHFFALHSVCLVRSRNFMGSALVLGSIKHVFSPRVTLSSSKVADGSSIKSISETQGGNQSSINPVLLKGNELIVYVKYLESVLVYFLLWSCQIVGLFPHYVNFVPVIVPLH